MSTSQVEYTDLSGHIGGADTTEGRVSSGPMVSTGDGSIEGGTSSPSATPVRRSNSGSGPGSLTGRLQLTNLKAEAQAGLGLGNESLGMKILETLAAKGGEKPWEEVMNIILVKKVRSSS